MRKVFSSLLLVTITLFLVALPIMAFATDGTPGNGSFFSWESIGAFSGAVALVVFLVQLLKLPLDRIWKIPTQYVVYVVSLVVLLLAQAYVPALGGLTLQSGFLCVFNAALVALAAMSTYEVTIAGPESGKLVGEVKVNVSVEDSEITLRDPDEATSVGPGMTT